MIASITIDLVDPDFEAFERRLRQADIAFTVASRIASEYPGRPLPTTLEIGGRISKYERGYGWKRIGSRTILSIGPVSGSSTPQTQELVRDLERAFPECKPIAAVDYPPVRTRPADRAAIAGVIVILLLAGYGLWCLVALLIHDSK